MGVDYSGNFGIGVQIKSQILTEDHEYYEDFIGYLDNALDDTDYFYFEVGDGMYSGEDNDVYVCIDNPFENGYCGLEEKVSVFYSFLAKNGLERIGEVDVVGGLEVD